MAEINRLKKFIIDWDNKFPCDRFFREKYKIPFNSPQHRQFSQIDIYLDSIEDKLYEKYKNDYIKYHEYAEEIKKDGKVLKEKENVIENEKIEDLFKDIKFNE